MSSVQWRKASRSSNNGGHCVELAVTNGVIAVRDSKDPDGLRLLIGRAEFRRFAAGIKRSRR